MLLISPTTAAFADTVIGSTSSTQQFVVTNDGGATSTGITTSTVGPFTISGDTCDGGTVASHATCRFNVAFAPLGAGLAVGSVTAAAASGGSPQAALAGTGLTAASLSFSPTSHDYLTVDVGMNASFSYQLSNSGTQPSSTPNITLSSASQGFSITGNTCTGPVLNGSPCSVTVQFAPGSAGSKAVTLNVSAGVGGSPSASLTGMGRDFLTLQVTKSGNTNNNSTFTAGGTITSNVGSINCGTTCSAPYARTTTNPTVVLTATTNVGTQGSVSWTGCSSSTANTCTITLSSTPTTVSATFALVQYSWNLNRVIQGDATGTFTYNGTPCASNCPVTYLYGDTATLVATPGASANPGYAFSGWTGGPCAGTTTSPCTVASVTSSYANIVATIAPYNYMFVSSGSYNPGSLGGSDPMGLNDGFRGGDALCQSLASGSTNNSLKFTGKTYRAWLASGSAPTVDAFTRLINPAGKQPRGWVRPDGTPFADLIRLGIGNSQIFAFPYLDQNSVVVPAPYLVATSANGDGTPEPGALSCGAWTNPGAPDSIGGDTGDGSHWWSRSVFVPCNAPARIYCFGIDYASPYAPPPPPPTYHRFFAADQPGWRPVAGGSVTDADNECKAEAVAYGRCASVATCPFKAVLATNGLSASARFTTNTGAPVHRLDGALMSTSLTNFFNGFFQAPPDGFIDQSQHVGGYFFQTGAVNGTTNGTAATTCNNWGATSGTVAQTQLGNTQVRVGGGQSTIWFDSRGTQADCGAVRFIMCMD